MEPVPAVAVEESLDFRQATHVEHQIPVATAVPFGATTFGHMFNGAAAVTVLPENEMGILTDRQRRLLLVYRLSRWIRLFAIIEGIFILIFGSIIPFFFILLPFPLAGILGCKYWSYRLMFVYILYLIIDMVGGAVSVYLLRNFIAVMVFRLIYTIGNVVVLYFAIRLASYMLAFEEDDRHFLLTSDVVKSFERHQLCC